MALAKSRWGFQCPLYTGLHNAFNYCIQVVINIPRGNPNRQDALGSKPIITSLILILTLRVMFTIDLDAHLRFRAKEVKDIRAD